MMTAFNHDSLAATFRFAALAAGQAIMEVFDSEAGHRCKADDSPVTVADERAEAIICDALETRFPDIPIVAEERVSCGIAPASLGERFFLIDALDGTREFIARRREFTVNIALVEAGRPVCGLVFAPALGTLYHGSPAGAFAEDLAKGEPARAITVRVPPAGLTAVASRSHATPQTSRYLEQRAVAERISIGSSLKFCLLAEGKADIYPRMGQTMEWDTAAGDAVLCAAGGSVTTLDGKPLAYGKRGRPDMADFANPFFIASSGQREEVLDLPHA